MSTVTSPETPSDVAQHPARRLEEPRPGVVLHQDHPTERAEQADELIGVQRHVPGDHRLLGLVEGNAWRDLQRLDERGPFAQRRRQLGLALVVDGCGIAVAAVAAEERLRLCDEARIRIGPRPHGRQRAPGNKDPTDLEQGGHRVHPVPRGRRDDGVSTGVGQGHRLAPARHDPHPGHRLGEHRPHAVVGFHGDHLGSSPEQQPGQCTRSGAQVDHRCHPAWQDPVHRLRPEGPGGSARRARPHPRSWLLVRPFVPGSAALSGHGRSRARTWRRPYAAPVVLPPEHPEWGDRSGARRVSRLWQTSGSRRWPRRNGGPRSACPSRSTGR